MHAGLNAIIQYEWEEAAIKLLILHAQAIDLKCAPVRGEHTASHHHVKSSAVVSMLHERYVYLLPRYIFLCGLSMSFVQINCNEFSPQLVLLRNNNSAYLFFL